jgi:hypothetical protein
MRSSSSLFALVAMGILAGCAADVPPNTIPEEVSCATCSIEVDTVTSFGDLEGPGALAQQPLHVHLGFDGRYYLWAGNLPQIFEADGSYAGDIGRRGSGPGEIRRAARVLPLPGDSLLVLESDRAAVFDSERRFIRQIAFGGGFVGMLVSQWPRSVLMIGNASSAPGTKLHDASFESADARYHRHGDLPSADSSATGAPALPSLASQVGPPWWLMQRPYRLIQYDEDLRPQLRLERMPAWWSDGPEPLGVPHVSPPHPSTGPVTVDSAGLLWVFIRVSSPNWREAWADIPRGAVEIAQGRVELDRLLDTLIEVIDPVTRRVVARDTVRDYILAASPDGRAAFYAPTPEGHPRVRIMRLALRRDD